ASRYPQSLLHCLDGFLPFDGISVIQIHTLDYTSHRLVRGHLLTIAVLIEPDIARNVLCENVHLFVDWIDLKVAAHSTPSSFNLLSILSANSTHTALAAAIHAHRFRVDKVSHPGTRLPSGPLRPAEFR